MSNFIKLSVSKTATFQNCKAKYKFSYIQKLPKKSWEFHTLGRFAHRILELFHLALINGATEPNHKIMSIAFNEALAEKEFAEKITSTAKEEVIEMIKTYLAQLKLIDKSKAPQILEVEKTFNIEINDALVLTGMIDRIQLDSDGIYHIVDYKTSKSKTYLKNDLLQLLTYAYVIYNEHPDIQKVRVSYIMLRLGCEFITKEFSADEILEVKNIYETRANEINNETEFEPNPQNLCRFCDFVNVCDAGTKFINSQFKTGQTKW